MSSIQNKTNSENGHLGLSIFKKNKKTTESVIFHLKFISKTLSNQFWQCLWNKDEISLTPLFSCFSWISRVQDVHLQNLVWQCLWNKDKISPTPLFSCFSWISRVQDVHFQNLFYFILYFLKLSACRGFEFNPDSSKHPL